MKFIRKGIIILLSVLFTFALIYTVSAKEKLYKNSDIPTKPTSLNITIKNTDASMYHHTQKLDDFAQSELLELGYTPNKINKMDFGDYEKAMMKKQLDEDEQNLIQIIYPELDDDTIINWTYGDYDKYKKKKNKELFKIEEKILKEFQKRNITEDDALYLKKQFFSYESALAQDDETLKKVLEEYYTAKLEYLEYLNSLEDTNDLLGLLHNTVYAATPPSNKLQYYFSMSSFANYSSIYLPDWVHVDSDTQYYSTRIVQEAACVSLHQEMYGSSSFVLTNIWGSYGSSRSGAYGPHEGIDFAGQDGNIIKSPVSGTVRDGNDPDWVVIVSDDFYSERSYFFMHMSDIYVSDGDSVEEGDPIGKQSDVNAPGGSHLHYAVELGDTGSTTSAGANHDIDSYWPYHYD